MADALALVFVVADNVIELAVRHARSAHAILIGATLLTNAVRAQHQPRRAWVPAVVTYTGE
jgi:hypothetical protein